MDSYFYANIKKCISEFEKIIEKDEYINKKTYEKFLDDFNDLFNIIVKDYFDKEDILYQKVFNILNSGYEMVEKKNKDFIENKLIEYKDYFDNMFKGIDNNIILDDNQRKAILIDEDYSLVIAGAGSGKTTTMAAKVKYLVEKRKIPAKKIVLLAFTRKATEELDMRINQDFKLNVEIQTFHKLGMSFIRKMTSERVKIIGEGTKYQIIADYVKYVVFPNKEKLIELMKIFSDYVKFDEKCLEYSNFNEYFKYYADKKYYENIDKLDEFIELRIKNRLNRFRGIDGCFYKSIGETKIANYLYINGYNYQYEKMYPHSVGGNHSYIPDFTINNLGVETYIEYYGMTKYYSDGKYSPLDIELYNKLIKKKQNLHCLYKTDLIELYYEYDSDNGKKASTTGNIYGIYDISGGAYEYTMGTTAKTSTTPVVGYNAQYNSGFAGIYYNDVPAEGNNAEYTLDLAYTDLYSYDESYFTRGRGKLGDATKETLTDYNGEDGKEGWTDDYAYFPYSNYAWFNRGGTYNTDAKAGVFGFNRGVGDAGTDFAARAVVSRAYTN